MSFTPGPWKVRPPDHRKRIVVSTDGNPSVGVAVMVGRHQEPEANARLIAAAPDLLETAIGVAEEYDGGAEIGGVDPKGLRRAIDDLRTAIAKAEGREVQS